MSREEIEIHYMSSINSGCPKKGKFTLIVKATDGLLNLVENAFLKGNILDDIHLLCLLSPLYNRFKSGASDKTGPIWFAYGFHL